MGGVLCAALATASIGVGTATSNADTGPGLDIIIHGGTVFDGSGSPGRRTDVGIKDGYIRSIGDLDGVSATRRFDATGSYVTPGFIDVHAHTNTGAPLAAAKSALTQGVTTETLGADGGGTDKVATRLGALAAIDKGINVAPYVGFNTVWEAVVGESDVRPTESQKRAMRERIASAMEQGAWGVSSGLGYTPAFYSRTDEVIDVVKAAGPWRAMFSDHIRDETDYVMHSTNEVINIGRQSGLMPEVTHMKVAGPLNWGKGKNTLRLLEQARESGTHAGGDVYPYTAAQTGLSFYVPAWAQDDGFQAMLGRFADPALRPRIDKEITDFVTADVGVPANVAIPTLDNKTIADFMAEYGGVSIGEAVMRVLEDHGSVSAVMHIGSEEDLKSFLQDPYLAISSDGGVTESARTHPRAYGSYPRFLGRYVRDAGYVTWAEGIRKMTGLPATMLGMVDRGFLAPGMRADVTVFDPATIIDTATFTVPRQFAQGVEWVFVNGTLALANGEPTGAHSGLALKRESNMPNRPMNVADEALAVRTNGTVTAGGAGPAELHLSLEQPAGAGAARGAVTVSRKDGFTFTSTALGRLQTGKGWTSVTGIGRTADGVEQPFVLTVDGHDPLADGGQTTVTLRVGVTVALHGVYAEDVAETPEKPGPAGPAGPVGPVGPAGPAGPAGAPGSPTKTTAKLSLSRTPSTVSARRRGTAKLRVTVRNGGTAAATNVRVCTRPSRSAARFLSGTCVRIGKLAPGHRVARVLGVRVKAGAKRGARGAVEVRVTGASGLRATATSTVRVR